MYRIIATHQRLAIVNKALACTLLSYANHYIFHMFLFHKTIIYTSITSYFVSLSKAS